MCEGAINGCQLCDIIWRHFFRDKSPEEYREFPLWLRGGAVHLVRSGSRYRVKGVGDGGGSEEKGDGYGDEGFEIMVELNTQMDREVPRWKTINMSVLKAEECLAPLRELPKPDLSIFSDNTWKTILQWANDCIENHPKCNTSTEEPPWYPTRLIDIQYLSDPDPVAQLTALMFNISTGHFLANCKLIETKDTPPEDPSYLTLSHRWPAQGGISARLETSNIEEMKDFISHDILPPRFREAILVARCLKVRYIWIDSLCIIQDSSADWNHEAQTMGDVYAHSLLNLCGTAALDILIPSRNPEMIHPCIVKSTWDNAPNNEFIITDFQFWKDRIYSSPCNKRAWITQERWLSPRILHFAFDQMVWECRTREAAETFPLGLPKQIRMNKHTGFKVSGNVRVFGNQQNGKEENNYLQDWYRILETYARSEVTFSKDRLVALAGIAQKFSLHLQDTFLSGLWQNHLPGTLLWSVHKGLRTNHPLPSPTPTPAAHDLVGNTPTYHITESSRLASYEAPSWSWASVSGDIDPGFSIALSSKDSMIELRTAQITPLDPALPFGRISSAHLVLRGVLYPLSMDPSDWPAHLPSWNREPPTIYISGQPKTKVEILEGSFVEKYSHVVHIRVDQPEEYSDIGRACFLPVARAKFEREGHEMDGLKLVYGLCVLSTGKPGEYKRLGRVDFSGEQCDLFEMGIEKLKEGRENEGTKFEMGDKDLYLPEEIGTFKLV
ncbi:uncharacterized protein EAF01_002003 [Botrytis porri]|uniref:Heterokaryon incompatibility domain-containing protein n=1 Tax=Botrytis porri TaxID=87229 RepID=A0A4Z1KN63_9HELO|nr:uncharacterized protein EAF01_002003 [Botrytis porri]KAF7912982.1 hypothetical protein EAF01_002003 [Botrytis porri]TGO86888.1 hypothetical protein BPOR_0268g00020 [Botrytis porri]